MRTFRIDPTVGCPSFRMLPSVEGTLRGDGFAQEPVWLEATDGRHLSVVWPQGFTVQFEPGAVLYNEKHEPFASAGEHVAFTQVAWDSAAGTFEDPYYAAGLLVGGCYPRAT